jgi:ubiquinone/menaquinone biosynthesis C-methylase UbiE
MRENENSVLGYFKNKAADYDLVDQQIYWRLSDALLWNTLNLQKRFNFLDAGGGTGRWSCKILEEYSMSNGTIYDLSPDMLAQAEAKICHGLEGRLDLIQGELQNMEDIKNNSYDIVFNFHNVLGFVKDPFIALSEMKRVCKDDGYVVSFVPNQYHSIFFNIFLGRMDEAETASVTSKGRFTKEMPYMHVFTPKSISELYDKSGLVIEFITGFPTAIYPGMQETQLVGSSENLSNILDDEYNFQKVYEIEKRLLEDGDNIAARGNNLFVVGKKSL